MSHRLVFVGSLALSLTAILNCGGTALSPGPGASHGDAGPTGIADANVPDHVTLDDGGPPPVFPDCGPGTGPGPVGRPTDTACSTSTIGIPPPGGGGGPISCATTADCVDAGYPAGPTCFQGKCSYDQCLVDTDCPSGNACACANQIGGNALHGNECLATGCRTDSECGSGYVCSEASTGGCGSVLGFRCHSAADTCQTSSDCCGSTSQCAYQETLGHWACQAPVVCAG